MIYYKIRPHTMIIHTRVMRYGKPSGETTSLRDQIREEIRRIRQHCIIWRGHDTIRSYNRRSQVRCIAIISLLCMSLITHGLASYDCDRDANNVNSGSHLVRAVYTCSQCLLQCWQTPLRSLSAKPPATSRSAGPLMLLCLVYMSKTTKRESERERERESESERERQGQRETHCHCYCTASSI